MKNISAMLGLKEKDVVSIIGCGGKTTLLYKISDEWRDKKVLMSTTTKILMPCKPAYDYIYNNKNQGQGIYLAFKEINKENKVSGYSEDILKKICEKFDISVLECDGSKGLPLKGYLESEPVIPSFTTVTIAVVTLSSLGKYISEAVVHRAELFCKLTDSPMGDAIGLKHIAKMLENPKGTMEKSKGRKIILFNKVENESGFSLAKELVNNLSNQFLKTIDLIIAGSLRDDSFIKLEW